MAKKKQRTCVLCYYSSDAESDCPGNLSGTQATCAYINGLRSTIYDCFYFSNVGLPHSVGSSVRVADLNSERNALAADFTFCHFKHLLQSLQYQNTSILPQDFEFCKHFLQKTKKISKKVLLERFIMYFSVKLYKNIKLYLINIIKSCIIEVNKNF